MLIEGNWKFIFENSKVFKSSNCLFNIDSSVCNFKIFFYITCWHLTCTSSAMGIIRQACNIVNSSLMWNFPIWHHDITWLNKIINSIMTSNAIDTGPTSRNLSVFSKNTSMLCITCEYLEFWKHGGKCSLTTSFGGINTKVPKIFVRSLIHVVNSLDISDSLMLNLCVKSLLRSSKRSFVRVKVISSLNVSPLLGFGPFQ